MTTRFGWGGFCVLVLLTGLTSAPVSASTFLFAASGTAATDGRPENAQAMFTVTSNTIVIELLNTAGPGELEGISSILSGITFKLTGGAADDLVILSATAAGAVSCTGGSAICPAVPVPDMPFGWTIRFSGGEYMLAAGGGSLKPYGIVNSNVTGNTDGMKNATHNPLLLGPVTFTLGFAGVAPTGVESTTFYFGTTTADNLPGVPEIPPEVVPEPASLLLTGGALLLVVWRMGRRGRLRFPIM